MFDGEFVWLCYCVLDEVVVGVGVGVDVFGSGEWVLVDDVLVGVGGGEVVLWLNDKNYGCGVGYVEGE